MQLFSLDATMFFFSSDENMKKPASKVAEPAQIQPKSQFLFHKNLSPRYFSIMTLDPVKLVYGPFGQANMHSTLDFCPRPARKEMNLPPNKIGR